MTCALGTEVRRWLATLLVAALVLGQVHGSAHALHGRATGPQHPCQSSTQTAHIAPAISDRQRGATPAPSSKQLCCHAICVMAAVQLAAPQVPVPLILTVLVVPPIDDLVADGFPDRLDRPPKAAAIG